MGKSLGSSKYYDSKIDFYNIHKINKYGNPIILDLIKNDSKVFDIGCNVGSLGLGLKKFKKCKVYGVDVSPKAVKRAKQHLINASVLDLENFNSFPFSQQNYDYIVLADVLEHVKNPQEVLVKIKEQLDFKYLIVSLPNIAFIKIRFNLMIGKFDYQNYGIMDESHLHFYTLKTSRQLLKAAGFKEIYYKAFPLTNKKFSYITHPLTKAFPTLLGRQFVFLLK